jgi:putative restriction endonuclease
VAEQKAHVSVALVELPLGEFDPNTAQDTRLKVIAAVHRRQGAPRFRRALMTAYEGRCAMTQYDAPAALEAAHILPYRGPQTNHPTNGLLLRADMHDLFDLGLVAVDPDSMRLLVAAELANTRYRQYGGQPLFMPSEPELRPNGEALEKHRAQSAVA